MAEIERTRAVKLATDYLKSNGGNNWKAGDELKRRTPDNLNFMTAVQLIADIYQRGARPRDLDLQKIDFSLTKAEIDKQIDELLSKRGFEQFDEVKSEELDSQIDRMEAMIQKEEEKLEQVRENVQEETEMFSEMEERGRLFEARSGAWTGYRLAIIESREMFNALIEAIEYARAILEIDEELDENFDMEGFNVLTQRMEKMEELSEEIKGLNIRASEEDQSESQDEETEESLEELVKKKLEDLGQTPVFDVVNQIEGETTFSEQEIESKIEEMKARGEIFEPRSGELDILDEGVSYIEDFSDSEIESGQTFGNIQVKAVKQGEPPEIDSMNELQQFLKDMIGENASEHLVAVYLDGGNDVLGTQTIGIGGLRGVDMSTRTIVQTGILMNAQGVIISHNHPSDVDSFTEEDVEATEKLVEQLDEFDLQLLDHILVSSDGMTSMNEEKPSVFQGGTVVK